MLTSALAGEQPGGGASHWDIKGKQAKPGKNGRGLLPSGSKQNERHWARKGKNQTGKAKRRQYNYFIKFKDYSAISFRLRKQSRKSWDHDSLDWTHELVHRTNKQSGRSRVKTEGG